MSQTMIGPVSPFFIVRNVIEAVDYYTKCLGFELRMLAPDDDPFFAIVGRGNAQLLLKAVSNQVLAQPNVTRHADAPWDGFVYTTTPGDAEQEFASNGALIQKTLHQRDDGLKGIEVRDLDGYVLFFGCPS